MCPPDHYGIHYVINPWMNVTRPAEHSLAVQQWRGLRDRLTNAGATVSELPPVPGLPAMPFPAKAGLIYHHGAIVSHFRHPQRQGEEEPFRRWFIEHGFETIES